MDKDTIKAILSDFKDIDRLIQERMPKVAEIEHYPKNITWYGEYTIDWMYQKISGPINIYDGYDNVEGTIRMPFYFLWDDDYLATKQRMVDKINEDRHAFAKRRRAAEIDEKNRKELALYQELKAKFEKPVDNS